jgi:tetratricopeptide (TPR) repeat protein
MMPIHNETHTFGDASIKGNLSQVHPAKLIFGFFKARKTGVLRFADGSVRLKFFLHNGCLVLHESGLFADPDFGKSLVRFGLVTVEEIKAFNRQAKEAGKTAVHLLIDRQIVNYGQVRRLANIIYERNVMGLFAWRSGDYGFYEQELSGVEDTGNAQQMMRWIIDGVRKQYNAGMVEDRLKRRLAVPLKEFDGAPVPMDELLISGTEKAVADGVREGRTLGELVEALPAEAKDVRAIVFGLLTIECAKFSRPAGARQEKKKDKDRGESADGAAPDRWERLFNEAERSVDRIHEEVAQEPPEFAPPGHGAAEGDGQAMNLAAELLRRAAEQGVKPPAGGAGDSTDALTQLIRQRIQERLEGRRRNEPDEASGEPLDDAGHPDSAAAEAEAAAHFEQMLAGAIKVDEDAGGGETEPEAIDLDSLSEIDLGDLPPLESAGDGAGDDTMDEFDRMLETAPGEPTAGPENGLGLDFDPPDDDFEEVVYEEEIIEFSEDDPPDQIYRMGVALLEEENWEAGFEALSIAEQRGYAEPGLHTHLGWAYFQTHEGESDRVDKAVAMVRKSLAIDQRDTQAYLYLGRIYLADGDKYMAELYFVKALEIDADCRLAKEYIRDIYADR